MFMLRDKGFFFFISSPHARCWEDLESRKMKLADIPEWDVTRDFLLTEQAYRLVFQQTEITYDNFTYIGIEAMSLKIYM